MSISPSLSPRQCPDRYAFRAGRNLPDKEFRYLRTVIVTAAVHRGFGRRLPCHQVTNFLDLPALGRRQPPYMVLRLCGDLCFWHVVRALAPPTAWELTVSCSISLPDGGSFHPSLTVLLRYRSERKLVMLSATGLSPSRVQYSDCFA
ncbi:hypothetical protein AAHA92_29297 [Salvia divinorum]|uniref:Uncharacterized protein n=1 Tax=Salvia divinorum TaxID=28513 RepID=A0ABD1FYY4_SALDI